MFNKNSVDLFFMEIHKKTWPELFQKVLDGEKKFDIRLGDFEIKEGDVLVLDEYDPEKKEYTGRNVRKKVSFIAKWKIGDIHSSEEIKKYGLNLIGFEEDSLMIKEMQKQAYSIIEKWNIKHDKIHDKNTVFPHLIEEVGEVAREYNHFINNWRQEPDKEKLSEELTDVLIQLLDFSKDFDINLEEGFRKKIEKLKQRFELD